MRTSPPSADPATFGLIAWLQQTRIQLPLRAVDCRFRVTGDVAVVELDQVFQQTAAEPLDVAYSFPLPHGAATFKCEVDINGRVIRARVMEAQQAREVAAAQKAQGHRTALVQAERENLFTLELGNVAPRDIITVRFAWFQTLERLGSQMSLRIPFCPGLRYIPGKPLLRSNRGKGTVDDTDEAPDASRISPPRIDPAHPDASQLHLEGTLGAREVSLATLSSPTHPTLIRPGGTEFQVHLAETAHFPDGDFVLRWGESVLARAEAATFISREEGCTYAMMQLRAPQQTDALGDWQQDIYFLVDRSGSMEGSKWTQCARALHQFVRELGEGDRVWITFFESSHQDFSDAPMSPATLLGDRNFLNIAQLGTAGGTELLPALTHVIQVRARYSKGRRSKLVVITDGQVGNEDSVLHSLRKEPGFPVYCFGIDTAVNDSFLNQCSRQQGGRCALMTPDDDIARAVRDLAATLRRPVVTGLRVQEGWELAEGEAVLPDLHAGETVVVVARTEDPHAAAFSVLGSVADGSPWLAEGALNGQVHEAPRLMWAQRRISSLLAGDLQPDAVAVAVKHNLLCRGASFIAWDESEKVAVAKREVYQPALKKSTGAVRLRKMAAPMAMSAPPPEYGCMEAPEQMSAPIMPAATPASPPPPASRSMLRQGFGGGREEAGHRPGSGSPASKVSRFFKKLIGQDSSESDATGSASALTYAKHRALALEVERTFGPVSSGDSRQRKTWARQIRKLFPDSNGPAFDKLVDALAQVLLTWASGDSSGGRRHAVDVALGWVAGTDARDARLEEFITQRLDGAHQSHAFRLLAALRERAALARG